MTDKKRKIMADCGHKCLNFVFVDKISVCWKCYKAATYNPRLFKPKWKK